MGDMSDEPRDVAEPRPAGQTLVAPGRRAYQKPILTCYGSVKTLTTGGSSGGIELVDCLLAGGAESRRACNLSDRRLKENIVRVGTHALGIGLYLFDYKATYRDTWGWGRQFGVMADEVEDVMPEAVVQHLEGYKMVDYAMLGIRRC